jgi:hypothetical protein
MQIKLKTLQLRIAVSERGENSTRLHQQRRHARQTYAAACLFSSRVFHLEFAWNRVQARCKSFTWLLFRSLGLLIQASYARLVVVPITVLMSFLPLSCLTRTSPLCMSISAQFKLMTSARRKLLSAMNNTNPFSPLTGFYNFFQLLSCEDW